MRRSAASGCTSVGARRRLRRCEAHRRDRSTRRSSTRCSTVAWRSRPAPTRSLFPGLAHSTDELERVADRRERSSARSGGDARSRADYGAAMAEPQSDALVLFGTTGDLAQKKLFPAMYHLGPARPPAFDGRRRRVASSWTDDQLRAAPARGGVRRRAGDRRGRARERRQAAQLRVAATIANSRRSRLLEGCAATARSTAVLPGDPAGSFDDVVQGSADAGLNEGARVVVEKPFGRDLQSADRAERGPAQRRSPRRRSSASTTSSARRHREPPGVPLRQLVARTDVEPQLHQACRSRWPRIRLEGRASSTTRSARSATSCRTTCSRSWRCSRMEPPVDATPTPRATRR